MGWGVSGRQHHGVWAITVRPGPPPSGSGPPYIAGAPFTLAKLLYKPCTLATTTGAAGWKSPPSTSPARAYCTRLVPSPLIAT